MWASGHTVQLDPSAGQLGKGFQWRLWREPRRGNSDNCANVILGYEKNSAFRKMNAYKYTMGIFYIVIDHFPEFF